IAVLLLTAAAAIAAPAPAAATGAPAGAPGHWSVLTGETVSSDRDAIAFEVGWPGVSFSYLHGVTDRTDVGIRFDLLYSYENTTDTAFGVGADVPLRLVVNRSDLVSIALHVDPGLRIYSRNGGTDLMTRFPVGGVIGVQASPQLRQAATLLKVRFADLSHLQNHLHVIEGRTLFFFREAAPRLVGADRVVIEFSLANSEQVSTLRGSVLGRVDVADGSQTGAWIEFPDAKLAKRLERGTTALATRQHQRVICDLLVEVRQGAHSFLARLMDVSMGGARIVGATAPRIGAMPLRAGGTVILKLAGVIPPFPTDLG